MLSTLSSWKEKAREYFRPTPSWQKVLEQKDLNKNIFRYLDLDAIRKWRLVSKTMNRIMVEMLENSTGYCFRISSGVEENSVKKNFKIFMKTMRLRNVNRIDGLQKWLKQVDTAEIREVEFIDCRLEWLDLLLLLYHFENMEILKIVARDVGFLSLYPIDENESQDKKAIDEKRFKLLQENEDTIMQGLPLDILRQDQRKLRELTIDSYFVHYAAILLKIFPIKYTGIEGLSLKIGSSDETQKDYKSAPHLFASLSNCLVKNASSLNNFLLDSFILATTSDKDQRIFFREFINSLEPMLKTPLTAITDLYLNFANPNFDTGRNRICKFIKSLTALKNIYIGPIQLKNDLEDLVLSLVPSHVNCIFAGIYMFQEAPKLIVPDHFSFSDVSFTRFALLPEDVLPKSPSFAIQDFNFKNYLPASINFEKSMIFQVLPLMTKLHIDQNPQVVEEEMRLYIQDPEMQLIISAGKSLTSLRLRCNLTLLTDSGLTGLTVEVCKNILEEFQKNVDAGREALDGQKDLEASKAGRGLSLSNLTYLADLAIYDAGPGLTDASAFLAICGMPSLKNILVTSPMLTDIGLLAIRDQFRGNVIVEWKA